MICKIMSSNMVIAVPNPVHFSAARRSVRRCRAKWTATIYHVVFAYMKYSTGLSQTLSRQGKQKGALLFLSPLCKLR